MTRSTPLVTAEWLIENLDRSDLVVLDATVRLAPAAEGRARGEFRSGLDQYVTVGHVPGARFADLFTEFSDAESSLPFTLPDRAQFNAAASRLGIRPDTHVIVYDSIKSQWAARLWWVFTIMGHEKISVLDGGLKRYLSCGGPLESGIKPYPAAIYDSIGDPRSFARRGDVAEIVGKEKEGTLVCLLQNDDFAGRISVRSRAGHIPGSVNLPFDSLIDEETNMLRPADQLYTIFSSVTNMAGERIVTYCGGGIASTLGALALTVIGYDNTLEYDGSLADWLSDPKLPLETVK